MSQAEKPAAHPINIQVDRTHYKVETASLTGQELRDLASIPSDRDLFRVVPGGSDVKIEVGDTVQLKSGDRFFTAPSQINPGA
ncbi:multiubiquitin domain-containing protein [Variovorax sp. GB1R11]|uniref:multiubiquitin domain-containing protein n=1 Tax=Variovorax sp. GB1R11 TaxID=3443741 RepID=UPI003F477DEB